VARQLLERGHQVILACRDASRGEAAAAQLQAAATNQQQQPATATAVPCDLASFVSVRRCAEIVQERWQGRLDVLVCNAAVIPAATAATTAADGINEQLQVNHLSHVLLAHLLLPCLAASAAEQQCGSAAAAAGATDSSSSSRCRIIVVGSRQHLQVPPAFQDPASVAELLSPQHARNAAIAAQLTPMQL
jgi:NAD(P)-dependent dehydrogenase (short-subunit alcohol dehydrogenase family)